MLIELNILNAKNAQLNIGNQKFVDAKYHNGCFVIDCSDYRRESTDILTFNDVKELSLEKLPEDISIINMETINVTDEEVAKNQIIHSYQNLRLIEKKGDYFSLRTLDALECNRWNLDLFLEYFKKNLEFFYGQKKQDHKNMLSSDIYTDYRLKIEQVSLSEERKFLWIEATLNNQLQTGIINTKIGEIIEDYNSQIMFIYEKANQQLEQNLLEESNLPESISLKFNFPKNLKSLCKQYLSYFSKFLSDNNVECELSLVDKEHITWMVINVDNSKIDIEKLKQALVGYFTLLIVKQENISFETYNIATQQLIANIEHLKSQLRLANLTIAQYENNSLANYPKPVEYVLIDSLEEESKVKLFDGLLEIGKTAKFKFFGIEIGFSIPKLIGKFKNSSEDIN